MALDILMKNCMSLIPGKYNLLTNPLTYIGIHNSLISCIGNMETIPQGFEESAGKIIDADGSLVLPGLVNGHNHCAMTLFRGLADDLPLTEWLQNHIFPAESRFVTPEMVYWCTRLAAAEMILGGTTTVADGYFHENEAASALKDMGMRAVAAQGVIDFPAPGVPEPKDNIDAAAEFIDAWQGEELITPAIFCHSPYTCSAQTIKKAKELANDKGTKLFMHVAETKDEVKRSNEQLSASPVRFLSDLGVLDHNTICVHCVWLDQDDIRILKESGASIITCSESNMKLGSGIAPVPAFKNSNIKVGIGTDGSASNNDLDMFSEMDLTAKIHKGVGGDPTILPASEIYSMATRNGADILGLDIVGDLSVGMKADIIIIDTAKPHLTPKYDLESLIVYSASSADVNTSIIDGKVLMENRVFADINLHEILDKVNEIAERVRKEI